MSILKNSNGPFGKFDPDNPEHQKWLRDVTDKIEKEKFVPDEKTIALLEKITKRGKGEGV
jgi:hypothetical protein